MNVKAKLIDGSVKKNILILTLPMMLGLMSVIVSAIADNYFVGQLGTAELAAMSFTFPVVIFFGNFSVGLGVGASSVIARVLGSGERERVRRLTTDALSLSLGLVAIFLIIGYLTMRPLFTLMGASGTVLDDVLSYMHIWYMGMIFLVVPMVGSSIIRATGNAHFPAMVMLSSAAVNIALDPLFIWGWAPLHIPAMGIEGAALASVCARAVAFVASFSILHFRYRLLDFTWQKAEVVWTSWKEILHVGIPTAASNVLMPVSASIITALVASFGHEAVAAFGIVSRIEALALLLIYGLAVSMGPFTGQNWGAKRFERVQEGLKFATSLSLVWCLLISALLAFFARPLVAIFDTHPQVIFLGAWYFYLVPLSYFFEGERLLANAILNAIGRPLSAMLLVLVRLFILYIPLAWVLAHPLRGEVKGIFFAAAVANVAIGLWARVTIKRLFTSIAHQ